METIRRYFRMDRRDIYLLRFFLEAYDGISGLSTIHAESGTVELQIAPGCEEDVCVLIAGIQERTLIQPLDERKNDASGEELMGAAPGSVDVSSEIRLE